MSAAIELDMDAANVDNFELDDFSRFIDHTLATDWEVLCNDIENAIKAWIGVGGAGGGDNDSAMQAGEKLLNVTYKGIKLTFGLYEGDPVRDVSTLFACDRALVMTRSVDDWPDTMTASVTKTIFSALVCSLGSCGVFDTPIFVVPTFIDEIFAAKELYGYELVKESGTATPRLLSKYSYSYLLEHAGTAAADAEAYLDGLRQIFYHNACQFTPRAQVDDNNNHPNSSRQQSKLLFAVKETYCYKHSGPPLPSGPADASEQSPLGIAHRCWDEASPYRYGFRSPLIEVSVSLLYPKLAENSFVDNVRFTTLVPSKQPLESWSIRASFRPDAPLHLSRCVLNEIALYVAGKCGKQHEQPLVSSSPLLTSEDAQSRCGEALSVLPTLAHEAMMAFICRKKASNAVESDYESFAAYLNSMPRYDASSEGDAGGGEDSFAGAAPVGSYACMLSLFLGGLSGAAAVADLWRLCAADFRAQWEAGRTMAHMLTPTAGRGGGADDESGHCSLMHRSLWDDVINAKRRNEGIYISLPDLSSSLLCQKLDMVHFCLATRNDGPVCSTAAEGHTNVIVPPVLLRRLPQTTDSLAQSQRLLGRISSGQSRTVRENPLLVWKIQQPELISDIRAFKEANPGKGRGDFERWYFGAPPPVDVEPCLQHWDSYEPAAAATQRPLFRCEAEAEKVLGFLENCSGAQFSADVLCIGLSTAFHMLRYSVDRVMDSCSAEGILKEVYGMVDSLRSDVSSAIELIQNSHGVAYSSSDDIDSRDSVRGILAAAHCAADGLERTERFALRLRELRGVLQIDSEISWRMLVSLASSDDYCRAGTAEEATALLALAKRVSRGAGHNTWHSYDARELGRPGKREVVVRYDSSDSARMQAIVGLNSTRISLSLLEEES